MTDPKRFDPDTDALAPSEEERSPVADRRADGAPSPAKSPQSDHPPIEDKTRESDRGA